MRDMYVKIRSWAGDWSGTIGVSVVALLAAMGTLVVYLLASDKFDDIALVVGGPLVGYLISDVHRRFSLERSEVRLRDATDALQRFVKSTETSRSVSIGRLNIPNGVLITASGYRRPYSDNIRFEFGKELADSRPDPPEWPILESQRLPKLQKKAADESRPFDQGPKLDLVGVKIERAPRNRTVEKTTYRLSVAETDYYRFACMPNMLDDPYEGDASGRSLRQIWGSTPRELGDLQSVPAPACIGIVVVVVAAKDRSIVCHERAKLFQVGADNPRDRKIHFIGEGMLPDDRTEGGYLSPMAGALRGLSEELGIEERVDSDVDLLPSGVYLDTQRWQPVFCYVASVPKTFEEIRAAAPEAKDSHEYLDLLPVPYTIEDPRTRDLLLGQSSRMVLASNHAQVALLLALVQSNGLDTVRTYLAAQHGVVESER